VATTRAARPSMLCYYEPCGGRVFPAEGQFFGYGRCRRCGVVIKRVRNVWRKLTETEWASAPDGLDAIRPWARP
jgi:hypothetical protein